MCGIAGFHLSEEGRKNGFPVEKFSSELLLGIEHRGKHATGYMSVNYATRGGKPKIVCHKRQGPASEFLKTDHVPQNAHAAILHTRWATQGHESVIANNHPVSVGTCYVVHNGHINNDDEVIKKTVGMRKRIGLVDSFAIPAALTHHGIADDVDLESGLGELEGGFAVAVIDPLTIPNQVILAKGENSPLAVLLTPAGIFWCSEKKALEEAWGNSVGTPPEKHIPWHTISNLDNIIGESGFITMITGEYIRYKADDFAKQGKFTVKRAPWSIKHYNYQPKQVTWTCYPTNAECVFGEDCGSCKDNNCKCFEENTIHPKLNKDIAWETLTKDKPWLVKLFAERGITKTRVMRMERPIPLSEGVATCNFCNEEKPRGTLVDIILSDGKKLKCTACFIKSQQSAACPATVETSPALAKTVEAFEEIAEEVNLLVDDAVQSVAWEFAKTVEFVRFAVFYQKKVSSTSEYGKLQASVRKAFYKTMEELRVTTQIAREVNN